MRETTQRSEVKQTVTQDEINPQNKPASRQSKTPKTTSVALLSLHFSAQLKIFILFVSYEAYVTGQFPLNARTPELAIVDYVM